MGELHSRWLGEVLKKNKLYFRFDPKIEMSAYNDNSPLETAIENDHMEIWGIMQKSVELSDQKKLEQLQAMIEKMDSENPYKEFEELLSSLPVNLVIIRKSKSIWGKSNQQIINLFWGEQRKRRGKGKGQAYIVTGLKSFLFS